MRANIKNKKFFLAFVREENPQLKVSTEMDRLHLFRPVFLYPTVQERERKDLMRRMLSLPGNALRWISDLKPSDISLYITVRVGSFQGSIAPVLKDPEQNLRLLFRWKSITPTAEIQIPLEKRRIFRAHIQ